MTYSELLTTIITILSIIVTAIAIVVPYITNTFNKKYDLKATQYELFKQGKCQALKDYSHAVSRFLTTVTPDSFGLYIEAYTNILIYVDKSTVKKLKELNNVITNHLISLDDHNPFFHDQSLCKAREMAYNIFTEIDIYN